MPLETVYKPNEKINPAVSIPLDTKQKNLLDYLMKYGKRITLRVINNAGFGNLLYQVPEGRVLFIVSASISGDIVDGDYCKLYVEEGTKILAEIYSVPGSLLAVTHAITNSNFPIPIRIDPSERIIGEGINRAVHFIAGYEVNQSEIF